MRVAQPQKRSEAAIAGERRIGTVGHFRPIELAAEVSDRVARIDEARDICAIVLPVHARRHEKDADAVELRHFHRKAPGLHQLDDPLDRRHAVSPPPQIINAAVIVPVSMRAVRRAVGPDDHRVLVPDQNVETAGPASGHGGHGFPGRVDIEVHETGRI